ncbi:MAG TPA: MFS transporter [Gammaproteobacteria bacterium]|nr:MFS transporter [Xanthomonadales bacterium]MCB1593617.1 MFS transporter [Xanthomonadales bacterium]HPI95420.1 MFS transporter [Gammaproteobacteria bacterium]
MSEHSQFSLLKENRFFPFFLTQFFGAFNDNVFKNALVIMIAYKATANSDMLVNLAAGLFILPFFLFSAIAGQIADKFEKSRLIRIVKFIEIIIMLIAAFGFYIDNINLLIFVLFLMGSQSSLFGPVKYGYLPQHLEREELIGGNALIESSTFLSILIGTILGGILIAMDSITPITVAILCIAVAGYLSASFIPKTPASSPDIKLNFNIFTETYRNISFLPQNRVVFLSILAISWFWFYGSVYLMQIPNFGSKVLGGDNYVITLLLSMFSVGIGLGSLLCEKLSGKRVEIGLVPIGAIGLAVFGYDIAVAAENWIASTELQSISQFWSSKGSGRILADLCFIGVFGGLYIVPLYALVQERADQSHLSRVIAGNNIINALFMVLAAVMAMVILVAMKWTIPQLFKVTVLLNIIVALYIFTVVPEFLMRLIVWFLVSIFYRIRAKGLENIPHDGAAVLACNHVSFIDPLILGGYIRRPVRFIMYYKIYNIPVLKWLFKAAKAIPIAGYKEDPEMYEKAFIEVKKALDEGDLVGIFPEGGLTSDGTIQPFKNGIEKIISETPVDVIPMSLSNLWGSLFSRKDKGVLKRRPRKFLAKIRLNVGEPISPENITKEVLRDKVAKLKSQK